MYTKAKIWASVLSISILSAFVVFGEDGTVPKDDKPQTATKRKVTVGVWRKGLPRKSKEELDALKARAENRDAQACYDLYNYYALAVDDSNAELMFEYLRQAFIYGHPDAIFTYVCAIESYQGDPYLERELIQRAVANGLSADNRYDLLLESANQRIKELEASKGNSKVTK